MIRCYYTEETLNRVTKARRYRAMGCGGFLYGWVVLVLIGITIQNPAIWFRFHDVVFLLGCVGGYCGMVFFFHRLLCNIEKTTLVHAGDEITLDDNEIRLVKVYGTQMTLPREGLKVIKASPYVAGNMSFNIRNPEWSKWDEIVLTIDMENAKELVETIQPGTWEEGE